jgi:hypothetical protein
MKKDWQPAWVAEKRLPDFEYTDAQKALWQTKKDFWGDVPAIDLVQLGANEGEEYQNDLRLLLAGASLPRPSHSNLC